MDTTIAVPYTWGILRDAARIIETLPHARVSRNDVHHAILSATPTWKDAQAALEALAAHLHAVGDSEWLDRWSARRSRFQVAAYLRSAASGTIQPTTDPVAQALWQAACRVVPPMNACLGDALQVAGGSGVADRAAAALAETLHCHPRDLPLWDLHRDRYNVADLLTLTALRAERNARDGAL